MEYGKIMSKKVFELAKELDMRPLDLVDKLRTKGYAVRNHMSSLSEQEVADVCAEFVKSTEETTGGKKKKAKKKTTRKAGSEKKKIVTVESKSAKKSTAKKISVRKKVTLRKKVKSEEDEVKNSQVEEVEDLQKDAQKSKSKNIPENAPTPSDSLDEVPRLNKFTSIYVPKSDDPWKKEKTPEKSPDSVPDVDLGKARPKESDSKRRLGDLASMISKKRNLSRAQVLQETRSEDELKSYSALSGIGRPIYTTIKKRKQYTGPVKETLVTEVKESKRVVKIHSAITAVNFAKKLKIKFKDMVDRCLDINLLVSQNDYLGISLASHIAELYDYRVENISFQEEKVLGKGDDIISEKEQEKLPGRNPVVAVMGHVDHGKTTLLDCIRNANVVSGEMGGITQHIGAYSVETQGGKGLTFLDTPGHLAFSSMRERGVGITDIVVLIVAADDGVMPQTRESIRHIQNYQVPLIVAINKMDKEGVNPDRIKQELAELDITPEEWGGGTQVVPISALKGEGIDDLLEAIVLQAEIMQLKAIPCEQSVGVILESRIEVGRGPLATLLVQRGTLRKGDTVVVGETYGRIRSLIDYQGNKIESAGPSTPVQVLGLAEAPQPGDELNVVKNEREAKKISTNRTQERKILESTPVPKKQMALEDFFAQAQEENEEIKELKVIVRSDVQGSYEAIKQSLEAMSNKEISVKVIGGGVGPINDNDVMLADFSKGIIFGFNMRPVTSARQLAEAKGVDVKTYSIIYELINDVEMALEGMLEPTIIEHYVGRAEAKETFSVPKVGIIAGSIVIDGSIKMGCQIRLLREGKILFDGKISSLKRFKDDVKEVKNGLECGIGLENYNDIKTGDVFEVYMLEHKRRTLAEVKNSEDKVESNLEESILEESNL